MKKIKTIIYFTLYIMMAVVVIFIPMLVGAGII